MTQYCATTCDTGTCSDYYSGYIGQNSTTATTIADVGTSVTGCNNWNYFTTQTGITSPSALYNSSHMGTGYNVPYYQSREVQNEPSEQELLRQREERVRSEEIAKKARENALEAEEKARLLLLEYLDNENKQRLLDRKPLEIPSRIFSDIRYSIPISNGRIKAWKENKVVTELCLAVRESGCLPTDDIVLTKLLHVLHDEENMLRIANHFDIKENLMTRLT